MDLGILQDGKNLFESSPIEDVEAEAEESPARKKQAKFAEFKMKSLDKNMFDAIRTEAAVHQQVNMREFQEGTTQTVAEVDFFDKTVKVRQGVAMHFVPAT